MTTPPAPAGPLASPGAIRWEAEAETLRCLSVDEQAWSLGFPKERWLEERGFLADTVFAPDRPLFLAGCRAAARGARIQERYRARSADGRPHWFELELKAEGPGRERCLRGRMMERPPEGLLPRPDSPLIIAHFDLAGRHLYVDREVEGVTGLPVSLFLGRTNEELGMPSGLVRFWREKSARVSRREEGEVFEFEFPSLEESGQGNPTLFQAHLEPVFDERGRLQSLRCETYRLAPPRRPRPSPRASPPPAEQRPRGLALLGWFHERLGRAAGREEVLRALGQLVGTELGDGCDVDLSCDGVLVRAASFQPPDARTREPSGQAPSSLSQRVFHSGLAERRSSPSAQVAAALAPDGTGPLDCMGVPLRLGERILGVLVFTTREPTVRFGADTLALAEAVAGLVAWALEADRSRRDEHTARARIEHFQRVVAALGDTRLPSQVADVIMGEVSRALSARAAVVYRLEPGGQALELLRSRGYSEASTRDFLRLPLELPAPITDALKRREPVWLDSPARFRRHYPQLAERVPPGAQGAWGAVPLMLEGRALGVLALSFDTCRDFSEEERSFALSVARQCAQALERAHLFESVQRAWRGLENLLEAAPLAILMLDLDGTVHRWNAAATRLFGWSAEEAVGHVLPVTPPGVRGELLSRLRASTRSGPTSAREGQLLRKDGTPLDAVYWISPLMDEQGQRRCIYIAADDTPRKAAERRAAELTRELRRQVAEFQTLLDVIPVGIGIARDPRCLRIQQNAWFARLLEVPVDTNVSLSAPEHERPRDVRILQAGRELRPEELPMQRAAATGEEVLDVELDLETRGRRLTLLASAAPLFDEAHRPRGAIASFLDITSHTRAMEAQRFLAESSAVLASSLDPQQLLQMLARQCVPGLADVAVLFGLRADGTLGVLSLSHADRELERQLVRAGQHWPLAEDHPLHEVLRTGQPRVLPEEEAADAWRANDDPERWHLRQRLALRSILLIPITSRQRAPHVLVLGSSERTYTRDDCALAQELAAHAASALDNARLYRDAREAVALRDEFLGIAGHELRTPLTALKLGLQNLSRQAAAVGQREHLARWISNCERQGERLNRLVNDLLDVGRLTSGRMPLLCERMDLCALVEEVVARMLPELELAGCHVSMELERPLLGYWDRSRLEQVLTNLLSNAVKYGKGKPIELRATALPGDQVRIRVRDEGIGISPEDQARIFERFERAVSERHYGGLGLGLWITRQLVLRFGGHIGVSSEQGKGSTFTVELPRQVDAEQADTSRGPSSSSPGRERGTASETLARLGGEALYRSILAALWEGIVVQDRDGNIISANASAEHILGLSVDELTGRTSMDPRWRSIHEDGSDFPGEEHPSMVALRTGKPVRNVLMGIQRPDGTRVWLTVNAQPLQREGESTPYLVVTSFFDITARAPPTKN